MNQVDFRRTLAKASDLENTERLRHFRWTADGIAVDETAAAVPTPPRQHQER